MVIEIIDKDTEHTSPVGGSDHHIDINSRPDLVAASKRGKLYSWIAARHSSGNDDVMLTVTNTSSTENLHIVLANAGSQNKGGFSMALFSGVAAGADAAEASWFPSVGSPALAVAKQNDVQGLTLIAESGCSHTTASGDSEFRLFGAFILAENETIGIIVDDGSPDTCGLILGYYE